VGKFSFEGISSKEPENKEEDSPVVNSHKGQISEIEDVDVAVRGNYDGTYFL
jgi:hypothetical protein